jgi:hypothetical protein
MLSCPGGETGGGGGLGNMKWIWTLLWVLLAAVVGVVARPFWDEYSSQILTIVIFANTIATISLWQTAARRPEKLRKKFLNRFWRSKPITPKHEPPPLEVDTPGVFGKKKETELMQFFSDFKDFANVVNEWLAHPDLHPPEGSPWRLQDLPKTELLNLWGGGGPTYGRCYAVFHNQIRLGEIEIRPDSGYSTENPCVTAHVELDWARLLAAGTIRSFLIDIATHISEYQRGTVQYLQTNQQIDLALTSVLWETQEISRYGLEPGYGEIEVELSGLASWYIDKQAWRAQQRKSPL